MHYLRSRSQRFWQLVVIGCLCFVIIGSLLLNIFRLVAASTQPVDAFFVLGGSITREIRVAQLAKQYPQIPILISQGSEDPCIWLIFQKQNAFHHQIWLEKCAHNTFTNFFYSVPIFRQWQVHKIKLITSPSHLPRAKWMAQIILGANGIWVEPEIVTEKGVPGNRESHLKTGLDVARSLLWALVSQVIRPHCHNLKRLIDVDMNSLYRSGFHCEYRPRY